MSRSGIFLLCSIAAGCAIASEPQPEDRTVASAVTAGSCHYDGNALAERLFNAWWWEERSIYGTPTGTSRRYCTHGGVCYSTSLTAFMVMPDGGIVLQVREDQQGGQRDWQQWVLFFDQAGNQTATIAGEYYFHIDEDTLLVSTARARSPDSFFPSAEAFAAVAPDGTIRWQAQLGGTPMAAVPPTPVLASGTTGSLLLRHDPEQYVWTYSVKIASGALIANTLALDPQTGAVTPPTSLMAGARRCTSSSARPECAAIVAPAQAAFAHWWSLVGPTMLYTTATVQGILWDGPGSPLIIEMRLRTSADTRYRIRNQLLFYDVVDGQPGSWPTRIVDGMYYFHRDPETLIVSTRMADSGSLSNTHTAFYEPFDRLIALRNDGTVLWDRSVNGGPMSRNQATFDKAGAAWLWTGRDNTTLVRYASLLDPATGQDFVLRPTWEGRALCFGSSGSRFFARDIRGIPDNNPAGASTSVVASNVVSTGGATVSVDISHFWRGDLIVTLLKDGVVLKVLSNREGGFNLGRGIHETYVVTADELGPNLNGTYTLHVADAQARYTGLIEFWKLAF